MINQNKKPTSKNEIRRQIESMNKLSKQKVPKPSPVVIFQKKKINP